MKVDINLYQYLHEVGDLPKIYLQYPVLESCHPTFLDGR